MTGGSQQELLIVPEEFLRAQNELAVCQPHFDTSMAIGSILLSVHHELAPARIRRFIDPMPNVNGLTHHHRW